MSKEEKYYCEEKNTFFVGTLQYTYSCIFNIIYLSYGDAPFTKWSLQRRFFSLYSVNFAGCGHVTNIAFISYISKPFESFAIFSLASQVYFLHKFIYYFISIDNS